MRLSWAWLLKRVFEFDLEHCPNGCSGIGNSESRTTASADVPVGDVIAAQAAGREIALVRLGEELFAIDATCTHGAASLCGGFVEPDGSIECPLHQGRFDVKTGRSLCAPLTQDLVVHTVRVHGGRLWVRLNGGAAVQA